MKFGSSERQMHAVKLSIFARCAGLIAAAAFAVAAVMYYQSTDLVTRVAVDGVAKRADAVNRFLSVQSAGGVRFGKADAVADVLTSASDLSEGLLKGALAVDAGGATVAAIGSPGSGALKALARRAIESGATSASGDGLLRADPVRFGPEQTIIGAVATEWSADAVLEATRRSKNTILIVAAFVFASALGMGTVLLQRTVSAPLRRVGTTMKQVVQGDYSLTIPETGRSDEIGLIARDLEYFRGMMSDASEATKAAIFQSAAFRASSAAMILADRDFNITLTNAAFDTLARDAEGEFREHFPDFRAGELIGRNIDVFHTSPGRNRGMVARPGALPMTSDIRIGSRIMQIGINGIHDQAGDVIGYVVEWADVTGIRRDAAVLKGLEAKQIRLQFDKSGAFTGGNRQFDALTGGGVDGFRGKTAEGMVTLDGTSFRDVAARLERGEAVTGRFTVDLGPAGRKLIDGSFCPIMDAKGRSSGTLLLGLDVTEQERVLAEAETARAEMQAAQEHVVDALRTGLARLREGDLTFALTEPLSPEYEQLREDFNAASRRLHDTIVEVAEMAAAMRGEVKEIVSASDDLSRRTEQQAATLEETAAAVAEITAAVNSAAEGARRATEVVSEARGNAESSGAIVGDAVAAMDEISASSDRISKIIGVIDDIAFQTNLLALNAGVEAARAGDAGRGFAVVASEVRALAQRSSEAAREINELITTSGQHVKSGAHLVGQAGEALRQIAASVTGISDHVTEIVSSSAEQSASLTEVNTAMGQLDQVTQQNAAMFEETTAASHALVQQTDRLTAGIARFRVDMPAPVTADPPSRAVSAPARPGRPAAPPPPRPRTDGALALDAEDDDWSDF